MDSNNAHEQVLLFHSKLFDKYTKKLFKKKHIVIWLDYQPQFKEKPKLEYHKSLRSLKWKKLNKIIKKIYPKDNSSFLGSQGFNYLK